MPHSPPSRPGTAPCAGGGLPEGLCRGLGAGPPGVQPDQGAGQGTGSRGRDPGRPRSRGKGPSDTALVPPPDHPSTSRHPRPRPRGLQAPPIRARGSVWPANPGPPFSAPSNHSPPFQSGRGPASSARSAAARPLRATPSPRSPQALLGPRKGAVPAQPRCGAAPLPHVPLRRCRCRRLCFRSRACAAAAPDRPCWDQGGRVAQLRAHVPSGSSSGRRGGGGSGDGPFNGAAIEQALPAQPRRGAPPSPPRPPRSPQAPLSAPLLRDPAEPRLRCRGARRRCWKGGREVRGPVPSRSPPGRSGGGEAGSGRERNSPWERGLRGQRGSWGRAGRERAGGDWRSWTLPDAGIGWAGTRGAGLCGPLAIKGVGGGRWGQFGGGAGAALERRERPGIGAAAGPRSGGEQGWDPRGCRSRERWGAMRQHPLGCRSRGSRGRSPTAAEAGRWAGGVPGSCAGQLWSVLSGGAARAQGCSPEPEGLGCNVSVGLVLKVLLQRKVIKDVSFYYNFILLLFSSLTT
ncbi:translation initiation factor IF-2-like [Manacus candei]|uniref:translation initiation factor IF-2-like n=1 Tax=Manacus candei TaxID=415023 RepID=UPI00222789A1|nr:translation initiation factor IF-2-like [Manacus candei]